MWQGPPRQTRRILHQLPPKAQKKKNPSHLLFTVPLRAPVPAYPHPRQPLCVSNLNAELVGGRAWVNASLWGTWLHFFDQKFHNSFVPGAEQKKPSRHRTVAFVCVFRLILWGEKAPRLTVTTHRGPPSPPSCAASAVVYLGLMDMTPWVLWLSGCRCARRGRLMLSC